MDKHWSNTKDRYYTLKPSRKKLYLNELSIEKETGYPAALHLMFPSDKIKEEFLYSENDPISSLMNGISNPSIIGVIKNGESFYLLVHICPKHPGWHDGCFITSKYDVLFCYKELSFMKGKEISDSISDDAKINQQVYRKLQMMGDCNSLIEKNKVFEEMKKYVNNPMNLLLIIKSLDFESSNKDIFKSFIKHIKHYMSKHKDFDFEKTLRDLFVEIYNNNEEVAGYIGKHLKKELMRSSLASQSLA